MILVIGSVDINDGHLDRALGLSLDHVRRSRTEPGCISHDVHVHAEHPRRLVFVERWTDRGALDTHFAVAASIEFVNAVSAMAATAPVIDVYETSDRDDR